MIRTFRKYFYLAKLVGPAGSNDEGYQGEPAQEVNHDEDMYLSAMMGQQAATMRDIKESPPRR